MTHAIRFHKAGGPEVLQWEDVQVGKPGPGEARVRNTAVGLNYVDTYVRSGHYPSSPPSGLGAEGAGVVEAGSPFPCEVVVDVGRVGAIGVPDAVVVNVAWATDG